MREFVHTPLMDAAAGATPQEPHICKVPAGLFDTRNRLCNMCDRYVSAWFYERHQAIERTVKAQMKETA